jgi:DNA ligase-1
MLRHLITRRTCAAWFGLIGAMPTLAAARSPVAIVLARDAPPGIDPKGYLVSEKYDGVRAVWDGHALRFRSGLPLAAPSWFIDRLPPEPLDGELWLGRGRFEALSGTVRRLAPDDSAWRRLFYMVFELPGASGDFSARAARLEQVAHDVAWSQLAAAPQRVVQDRPALVRLLNEVVRSGGEGLVLHRAAAPYETGRSTSLLKLKPQQDAEAVVLAHVAGRGKHAGRLGALRVRTADGVDFVIGTGFSDAEREAPPPIGSVLTFSYRGTTTGGVPRFASFLRLRDGA